MAELRKRSSVAGPPPPAMRTPDGTINNCAMAHGELESECQVCTGWCPDREKIISASVQAVRGPTPRSFVNSRGEPVQEPVSNPLDEGVSVSVTWGEEVFCPVQYSSMRVGPFSASTTVRPGESVHSATERLHRELSTAAKTIADEKGEAYLQELAALVSRSKRVEVR